MSGDDEEPGVTELLAEDNKDNIDRVNYRFHCDNDAEVSQISSSRWKLREDPTIDQTPLLYQEQKRRRKKFQDSPMEMYKKKFTMPEWEDTSKAPQYYILNQMAVYKPRSMRVEDANSLYRKWHVL